MLNQAIETADISIKKNVNRCPSSAQQVYAHSSTLKKKEQFRGDKQPAPTRESLVALPPAGPNWRRADATRDAKRIRLNAFCRVLFVNGDASAMKKRIGKSQLPGPHLSDSTQD